MSGLFLSGDFMLHSGERSNFKIDCDALSEDDIATLAGLIAQRCTFGAVEGVPRGGLRLAAALAPHCRPLDSQLLLVDDVYSTGTSLEAHRAGREARACVIFSRAPRHRLPWWVQALFSME